LVTSNSQSFTYELKQPCRLFSYNNYLLDINKTVIIYFTFQLYALFYKRLSFISLSIGTQFLVLPTHYRHYTWSCGKATQFSTKQYATSNFCSKKVPGPHAFTPANCCCFCLSLAWKGRLLCLSLKGSIAPVLQQRECKKNVSQRQPACSDLYTQPALVADWLFVRKINCDEMGLLHLKQARNQGGFWGICPPPENPKHLQKLSKIKDEILYCRPNHF